MVAENFRKVDNTHAGRWRDAANYAFIEALPPAACAWEFLRRNPDYQKAWRAFGSEAKPLPKENSGAATWGLLRFESPDRDARSANVFWQPSLSREVLPVIALQQESADQHVKLSLDGLHCRVTLEISRAGEQHILFAEDGRSFQLAVQGIQTLETARLASDIVFSPRLLSARLEALKRFADMLVHRRLRPTLYRPDRRAARWLRVLPALDGWLAGARYRDIAVVLFGEARVATDWNDPRKHLFDRVRRAVRRGRELMQGEYRGFLR